MLFFDAESTLLADCTKLTLAEKRGELISAAESGKVDRLVIAPAFVPPNLNLRGQNLNEHAPFSPRFLQQGQIDFSLGAKLRVSLQFPQRSQQRDGWVVFQVKQVIGDLWEQKIYFQANRFAGTFT